jgi:hypothetical protein
MTVKDIISESSGRGLRTDATSHALTIPTTLVHNKRFDDSIAKSILLNHNQPINVPTAGAQALLMDYT